MKYRPRVATLFSTASPSRCTPQNTCAGRHGDGVREHITSTRHRGNRRSHVPGPSTCACNLGRGVSALHPDASQQPDTAQPGDQGVVFKGIPRREKKPVKAPTEPNPLRSKQHHFTAYCRQSHSIFFSSVRRVPTNDVQTTFQLYCLSCCNLSIYQPTPALRTEHLEAEQGTNRVGKAPSATLFEPCKSFLNLVRNKVDPKMNSRRSWERVTTRYVTP